MPDGGRLSHEAVHLLAGETSGENGLCLSAKPACRARAGEELLQDECEPQALADALLPLLADGKTSHQMHDTFRELHQQIRCNADEQAAEAVLELAK